MDSAGFQSEVDAPDGEHNRNLRPGIVHRLDKGTTGVLLAAKNPTMQAKLGELFAERRVSETRKEGGVWVRVRTRVCLRCFLGGDGG